MASVLQLQLQAVISDMLRTTKNDTDTAVARVNKDRLGQLNTSPTAKGKHGRKIWTAVEWNNSQIEMDQADEREEQLSFRWN